MASIFKRGGRRGKGGYIVSWYPAPGLRKSKYAGKDRAAAEALARKLEADALLRREGVIDPKADAYAAAEARPLDKHLADFGATLRERGNTEGHATHTTHRAGRVLALAKLSRISELSPSRVQAALADLRAEGCSLATCNHYLRAVKSFSRWLWRDGRTREDSLAPLSAFKVTEARRERRALSDGELTALLHVAHEGAPVLRMAGPDRAMVYAVAVGTGLRASELGSLRPESFGLDDAPPVVVVACAYTKNREEARQPLPPALVEPLRQWLAGKEAGREVFKLPDKTAKMMRVDLVAAGIPYATAEGVADFHSLRHTYVSRLVRSGVNVKLCQELARHSTPVLTLGRYTHVDMQDKATALTMVPALQAPRDVVAEGNNGSAALQAAHALPESAKRGEPWQEGELDSPGAGVVASHCGDTTCQLVASRACERALSSVGQSRGLIIPRSEVRVLQGPPLAAPPASGGPDQ